MMDPTPVGGAAGARKCPVCRSLPNPDFVTNCNHLAMLLVSPESPKRKQRHVPQLDDYVLSDSLNGLIKALDNAICDWVVGVLREIQETDNLEPSAILTDATGPKASFNERMRLALRLPETARPLGAREEYLHALDRVRARSARVATVLNALAGHSAYTGLTLFHRNADPENVPVTIYRYLEGLMMASAHFHSREYEESSSNPVCSTSWENYYTSDPEAYYRDLAAEVQREVWAIQGR